MQQSFWVVKVEIAMVKFVVIAANGLQIPQNLLKYVHLISNWTDNCSELPTEFCAWHVYKPASRRPTGLSCKDSYFYTEKKRDKTQKQKHY